MRVLWLDWQDTYASKRMREEAEQAGIDLAVCEILEVSFVAAGSQIGVFNNNVNLAQAFDVLVVRNFHPYISEALTIARLFKEAGKKVIDQSLTEEGYAISKMHDYLLLAQAGLAVPLTYQTYRKEVVEELAEKLGYPCVLKGVHGSQGQHVHKINDRFQLRRILAHYPDGELALQEFLPAEEDYRVMTVGFQALPVFISRRPRPGDFRTNFALEGEGAPHPLSAFPALGELAEKAARALKREFSGVDMRLKKDAPVILEVNRRPDFDGFESVTKLNVAGAWLQYILSK